MRTTFGASSGTTCSKRPKLGCSTPTRRRSSASAIRPTAANWPPARPVECCSFGTPARTPCCSAFAPHQVCVNVIEFSPTASRAATVSCDKTAKIWDTNTWQPIAELSGFNAEVTACQFSPDGATLAIGAGNGDDKTTQLYLYDARTAAQFGRLECRWKWHRISRVHRRRTQPGAGRSRRQVPAVGRHLPPPAARLQPEFSARAATARLHESYGPITRWPLPRVSGPGRERDGRDAGRYRGTAIAQLPRRPVRRFSHRGVFRR